MSCPSVTETPSLSDILPVVDAVLASLARRLPAFVSREDLASAAKIALIEALDRFEGPAHEARAYCYIRVRGAVFDELRRLDPLSRRTRDKVNHVRRTVARLEARHGRAPTQAEVAQETGLSVRALARLDACTAVAEPCAYDEAFPVADTEGPCPARTAEAGDTARSVREALGRLPAVHARVLVRYHVEEATLEEIAGELGVSKERVRQIREAAERKLRLDAALVSHRAA